MVLYFSFSRGKQKGEQNLATGRIRRDPIENNTVDLAVIAKRPKLRSSLICVGEKRKPSAKRAGGK